VAETSSAVSVMSKVTSASTNLNQEEPLKYQQFMLLVNSAKEMNEEATEEDIAKMVCPIHLYKSTSTILLFLCFNRLPNPRLFICLMRKLWTFISMLETVTMNPFPKIRQRTHLLVNI
jgi:hypothetical protein